MPRRNEIEILIRAKDLASKHLKNVSKAMDSTKQEVEGASAGFRGFADSVKKGLTNVVGMTVAFTAATVAVAAMSRGIRALTGLFKGGVQSIDEMRLSVASMASAIATFSPETPFKDALKQAKALIAVTYELEASYIGSAEELQKMIEALTMNKVQLDLVSESGKKAFITVANALRLVTQGANQQIQIMQELFALAQGRARMTDRLALALKAAGVDVAKQVPLWKQQGILIEQTAKYLKGYAEGTELIKTTLQAHITSLKSIWKVHLRAGMEPAYERIVELVGKIRDALVSQDGKVSEMGTALRAGLAAAWEVLAANAEVFFDVISGGTKDWADFSKSAVDTAETLGVMAFRLGRFTDLFWTMTRVVIKGWQAIWYAYKAYKGDEEARAKIMAIGEELERLGDRFSGDIFAKGEKKFLERIERLRKRLKDGMRGGVDDGASEARTKFLDWLAGMDEDTQEALTKMSQVWERTLPGAMEAGLNSKEVHKALIQSYEDFKDYTIKVKGLLSRMGDDIEDPGEMYYLKPEVAEKAAYEAGLKSYKAYEKGLSKLKDITGDLEKYGSQFWNKQVELIETTVKVGNREYTDFAHKFIDLSNAKTRAIWEENQAYEKISRTLQEAQKKFPEFREAFISLAVEANEVHKQKLDELEVEYSDTFRAIKGLVEDAARTMASSMEDTFFALFTGKLDSLTDLWHAFTQGMVRNFARAAAQMVTDFIKVESVIKAVKGLLGISTGLATGPGTAGYETGPVYAPVKEGGILPGRFTPIKSFAEGGIATRRTMGIIAEAGYPEAVIPLKTGKVPVELKGKDDSGIGGKEITIVNVTNPDDIVMQGIANRPDVVLNVIAQNRGNLKKLMR